MKENTVACGPLMHFSVPQADGRVWQLEMGPVEKADLLALIRAGGLQDYDSIKYLRFETVPTLEDLKKWHEESLAQDDAWWWGLWIKEQGGIRRLAGVANLHNIKPGPAGRTASSCVFVMGEYRQKGIAAHVQRARTLYAFEKQGLMRIETGAYQGNPFSQQALESCGYMVEYVNRNAAFADGKLRHVNRLACLNPLEPFWSLWWGEDPVPAGWLQARERTLEAMNWARTNVKFS